MIGRGLRKSPNKYDCFVLEFSGNDEQMMCWEDIDQNCTFQSSNASENKSKEEALSFYKGRFKSPNVTVLNVRFSPFNFYECDIRRIVKYDKFFYYCPHERGFALFELLPNSENRKYDRALYGLMSWNCFWKDQYKSFYIWCDGTLSHDKKGNYSECSMEGAIGYFKFMLETERYGRWYPSEEEPMTGKQKSFLKVSEKMSARKAEMHIEDCAIKLAIRKYFIDSKPEPLKVESSHSGPIMELQDRY